VKKLLAIGITVALVGLASSPADASRKSPKKEKAAKAEKSEKAEKAPAADEHGFDYSWLDKSVNPGDDFFHYACGGWLKKNPIPADYPRWGVWNSIEVRNFEVIKKIMEDSAKLGDKGTHVEQLVGNFWAAGMDTKQIEAQALKPLSGELDRVAAVKDVDGLIDVIARWHRTGLTALFKFGSAQDYKDSTQVIGEIGQGGLGLPERDYYTRDDKDSTKMRAQYAEYVATMLGLLGDDAAKAKDGAAKVLELETRLAKASLNKVERRDPKNTYHKMNVDEVQKLTPKLDWKRYFKEAGKADVSTVNVESPVFVTEAGKTLTEVPLDTWKTYLRFHLIDGASPFLDDKTVNANFAFRGKILTGRKQLLPRFKRVINAGQMMIGEAVGETYVKKMFSPKAKEKANELVSHLKDVLKDELGKVEWMTPETRKKAIAKLEAFNQKIGYPDKWRDYATLNLDREAYFANVQRCREFEAQRDLNKIGKPLDRSEWYMPPQMINAYYDPQMNEIVFPAAILQPPLFDPEAEFAKNLGGIGAVIGHEMGHGFDDQGAKFDAKGNMTDWWAPEDFKKFEERTNCVAKQFDTYGLEGGPMTTGKSVVGEACGDLTGMVLSYKALERSVKGTPAETAKDAAGFTVFQRFFIAFGQSWGGHSRVEYEKMQIQSDPHPLNRFRVNGTLSNMPEFFEAFGIKEGKMMPKAGAGCRLW
jgi:putative endopeptidase